MKYSIPPFRLIPDQGGGQHYPGDLPSEHALRLETIHNDLRSSASFEPDRQQQHVCVAIQQCYDLLKQIVVQDGGKFSSKYLAEELPTKVFGVALEAGWLPEAAANDPVLWKQWITEFGR
jgi:hypothetical protein